MFVQRNQIGSSRSFQDGGGSDFGLMHESVIYTALGSDGQGPNGFSFVFLDLFAFFDPFADLARACLGFLGASVEVVRGRASTYGLHNRTACAQAASLDARRPGPDLTWQRTLAVVVCAALEGAFKGRK